MTPTGEALMYIKFIEGCLLFSLTLADKPAGGAVIHQEILLCNFVLSKTGDENIL